MGGALIFTALFVGAFVIGSMYARNRIMNKLIDKGYNSKDVMEVVKIWT